MLAIPIGCIVWLAGCDSTGSEGVRVGGAAVDPAVEAANAAASQGNADLASKKADGASKKPK
ncbi:hypothetical protein [Singulisphaera sp. GP187]|uniref:hypothetical protein n=1 Tax=Singulisphaera sp. GP187 TaxID=1882752 RepID=UPI000940FFBA|nr:hypothetical protein [Singulisphaera sp. GP187]